MHYNRSVFPTLINSAWKGIQHRVSALVCYVKRVLYIQHIRRITKFSSSSTKWSRLQHECAPSCGDECCENSFYSLLTRIIWPTSLSLLIFTPVNRQPRAMAAGFPVSTNTPSGLLLMLFKTPSALICKFHHPSLKKNRGKPRRTYAPLLSLQCELSLWLTRAKLKHPKTTFFPKLNLHTHTHTDRDILGSTPEHWIMLINN